MGCPCASWLSAFFRVLPFLFDGSSFDGSQWVYWQEPSCFCHSTNRLACDLNEERPFLLSMMFMVSWTYLRLVSPLMEMAEMKSVCSTFLLLAGKRNSYAAGGGCCRMQYQALSACEPLLVVLPRFPFRLSLSRSHYFSFANLA